MSYFIFETIKRHQKLKALKKTPHFWSIIYGPLKIIILQCKVDVQMVMNQLVFKGTYVLRNDFFSFCKKGKSMLDNVVKVFLRLLRCLNNNNKIKKIKIKTPLNLKYNVIKIAKCKQCDIFDVHTKY
jgi:hypothetical protein